MHHSAAGSDGGAEHWAAIASFVETCKLHGVEPFRCVADLIARIVEGHPQGRLNKLLPWDYRARRLLKEPGRREAGYRGLGSDDRPLKARIAARQRQTSESRPPSRFP